MFSHQHSTVLFIALVAVYVVLRVVRHWANIFDDQSVFVLRYWYYRRALVVNFRGWLRETFVHNWLVNQIKRGYFPRVYVWDDHKGTARLKLERFPCDSWFIWFGPVFIQVQWYAPTSSRCNPILNFNDCQ